MTTTGTEHLPGEGDTPADGLPRRFGINAIMNFAASAGNALYSLAVIPLIVRGLGKSAFGVWAIATSVTSYLELFNLGFGAATTKKVAEDAGHRPERVRVTINTGFFVLVGFGVLALIASTVMAFGTPRWFDVPGGLREEAVVAVLALGVLLAASVPGDSFGGALAGHQRFDLLSLSNLIQVVLTSVASVVVIVLGGGIVPLAVSMMVIGLAMHPLRWAMLRRVAPDLRLSPRYVDRGEVRSMSALSGWFLVSQLSGTVIFRIDTVVVGAVLGVEAAAVYAVGSKLAFFCQRAARDLATLLMPHATSLYHSGQEHRVRDVLLDGARLSMLMTFPAAIVLAVMSRETLKIWVGEGYGGGAAVLLVLALTVAVRALLEPTFAMLTAVGRVRTMALTVLAEAVVNAVASVVLAREIGLVGVAYGTLIGFVTVLVPMWVYSVRVLEVPLADFARASVVPHLLPAALTTAVVIGLNLLLPVGLVWLVVIAAFALTVYWTTYVRVGATASERARFGNAVAKVRHWASRASALLCVRVTVSASLASRCGNPRSGHSTSTTPSSSASSMPSSESSRGVSMR